MSPSEILPGVEAFLQQLRSKDIAIALGSASKNAEIILEKVRLRSYFQVLIDGNKVSKSKPDPEVFLKGAEGLGLPPSECIVFEDAEKGLAAAKAGGFFTVGVGDPALLHLADLVIPNFLGQEIEDLFKKVKHA
jgi:beta-phosphoglucomutase